MSENILMRNWLIKQLTFDPIMIAQHQYWNEISFKRYGIRLSMNSYLLQLIRRASKNFDQFLEKDQQSMILGIYVIGFDEIKECQQFYFAELIVDKKMNIITDEHDSTEPSI